MSDDQTIADEIRAKLAHDSRIPHPSEVAVSVRAGTVTLRGSVATFPQRRLAVEIASAVAGVNDVEDELKVDLHDSWVDNEIRGAAIQALMSDPDVPDQRIEVAVADSWLTLKGDVEHQEESNAAFEAVAVVAGVGGITNKITVITAGIDG